MAWTFFQKTGAIMDNDGNIIAIGYAGGNCGKDPDGRNNPNMQDVPKVGPLPCGTYTMVKPIPQSQLGPFAIPLVPDATNEMFGRSSFYIHGDRTNEPGCASEGCIIMPRQIREKMWSSDDHDLIVVRGD